MAGLVLGEAEAVRAYDCAVFKRHMVAQDAILAHNSVGVSKEMAAGLNAGIEDDMGQKGGVGSETHAGAYHDVGADMRVGTDDGGWGR